MNKIIGFFLFSLLLLGCAELTNQSHESDQNKYIQNFADTLLCACRTVVYKNDTNLFVTNDDFLTTLIAHIDDSTKREVPNMSHYKSTESTIPSTEVVLGMSALCYLERIIMSNDSAVISKDLLCRSCSMITEEYDKNKYEKSTFLLNEKQKYESWYNETKGMTWDKRKQIWKARYMINQQ